MSACLIVVYISMMHCIQLITGSCKHIRGFLAGEIKFNKSTPQETLLPECSYCSLTEKIYEVQTLIMPSFLLELLNMPLSLSSSSQAFFFSVLFLIKCMKFNTRLIWLKWNSRAFIRLWSEFLGLKAIPLTTVVEISSMRGNNNNPVIRGGWPKSLSH